MKVNLFKNNPSWPPMSKCEQCGEEAKLFDLRPVLGGESDGSDDELWCSSCLEKALGNSQKGEESRGKE